MVVVVMVVVVMAVVVIVAEVVMSKGRGRLLDYLMEFLASSCYIERTEEGEVTRKFGTC
jgi:hypothetical protein